MRYLPLKHKTITIDSKAQIELDAGDGSTLVPDENSKVFLHWKNDTGKLVATYTMTFPTKIEGKVTMINALDKSTQIRVIW